MNATQKSCKYKSNKIYIFKNVLWSLKYKKNGLQGIKYYCKQAIKMDIDYLYWIFDLTLNNINTIQ